MTFNLKGLGELLQGFLPGGKKRREGNPAFQPEEFNVAEELASLMSDPGQANIDRLGLGAQPPQPTPAAPPTTPPSQFGQRSPESQELSDFVMSTLNELKGMKPPENVEVDPIEQMLSIYANSQGGLPAMQNSLGAPFALSEQRNQKNTAAYQAKRDQTENALKFGLTGLNTFLDRDTAVARVEQQWKINELKVQSKTLADQAKTDERLHQRIAQGFEKGVATETSIMEYAIGSGMEAELAQAYASQVMENWRLNPQSFQQSIQAAQLKIQGDKQQTAKITELRAIADDTVNQRPDARYRAMRELQLAGDPLYAGLTIQELREEAQGLSLAGQSLADTIAQRAERHKSYMEVELPAKFEKWDADVATAKKNAETARINATTAKGNLSVRAKEGALRATVALGNIYSGNRNETLKEIGRVEGRIVDAKKELERFGNQGEQGAKQKTDIEKELLQLGIALNGDGNTQKGLRWLKNQYQTAVDATAKDIETLRKQATSGGSGGGTRPPPMGGEIPPYNPGGPGSQNVQPDKSPAFEGSKAKGNTDDPKAKEKAARAALKTQIAKVGRSSKAGKRMLKDFKDEFGVEF